MLITQGFKQRYLNNELHSKNFIFVVIKPRIANFFFLALSCLFSRSQHEIFPCNNTS